jgi:tripeptide aminopeptidase
MKYRVLGFILLVLQSHAVFAASTIDEQIMARFIRYVQIDTQSDDTSSTVPTSENQMAFAKQLANELRELGVNDVRVSEFGFVYALLPANTGADIQVQPFGLIAHLDTSPDISGKNVKPIVHRNYQGGDIVLPADPKQVIRVAANPELNSLIGDDIITADGTTLLGSDDKAGIAAIMDLVARLQRNPQIMHGDIAIAFTPDEETSMGIEKFDVANFPAKVAYTVDGGALGNITNETWHAREVTVEFVGQNAHTGKAKGAMINAGYAAASFVTRLPASQRAEQTDGRTGFIHLEKATISVANAELEILLRDFSLVELDKKSALIHAVASQTQRDFPNTEIKVKITDNYANMYDVIKAHPYLVENAMEAATRAGITPKQTAARWGTDGSSLSFMGLPSPDIFTGGYNFHSKLEFNSRKGLEGTAETLFQLSQIFVEQGTVKTNAEN